MFFGSFKTSKGMFSLDYKILQIAIVILETIYFIKYILFNIEINLLIKRISNILCKDL